jgi:hypothetical protein
MAALAFAENIRHHCLPPAPLQRGDHRRELKEMECRVIGEPPFGGCSWRSVPQAGDAAARRIIGFSPDGNYFAFEQYGTLDAGASASGWSEIDIIDTRTDQFVGGKPIHVVDETEESTLTLEQARAQAAAQAAPILARYAIAQRGERTGSDRFTFPDDMVAYGDIARLERVSQKCLSPTFDELGISTIQLDQILAGSTHKLTF